MQITVDKLMVVLGLVLAYLVFTKMVKLPYIRTFREKMVVDEKALAVLRRKIAPELRG